MEISYQYSEKQRIIKKQPEILNIQTGEGREVGQPECNFGPQYKKCTLTRFFTDMNETKSKGKLVKITIY